LEEDHPKTTSILPPWCEPEDMMVDDTGSVSGSGMADTNDIKGQRHVTSLLDLIPQPSKNISSADMFDDANDEKRNGAANYRDYSRIPFAKVSTYIANHPSKSFIFPVILHRILSSNDYGNSHRNHHDNNSIAWLLHGRAFAVVDSDTFFEKVTPRYFCTHERCMFERWIEKYGFEKVECWDSKNARTAVVYYHEKFLRFRPWLAYTMKPKENNYDADDDVSMCNSELSEERTQGMLEYFHQNIALENVMFPYSALFNLPWSNFQDRHYRRMVETATSTVASHAIFPQLRSEVVDQAIML